MGTFLFGIAALGLMIYLAHDRWVRYRRRKYFRNLMDRINH